MSRGQRQRRLAISLGEARGGGDWTHREKEGSRVECPLGGVVGWRVKDHHGPEIGFGHGRSRGGKGNQQRDEEIGEADHCLCVWTGTLDVGQSKHCRAGRNGRYLCYPEHESHRIGTPNILTGVPEARRCLASPR